MKYIGKNIYVDIDDLTINITREMTPIYVMGNEPRTYTRGRRGIAGTFTTKANLPIEEFADGRITGIWYPPHKGGVLYPNRSGILCEDNITGAEVVEKQKVKDGYSYCYIAKKLDRKIVEGDELEPNLY